MNDDTDTLAGGTEIVARVGDTVASGIDDLRRSVADVPIFAVHEIEGRTVITASTLSYSGGFGFGGGSGPSDSVRAVGAPAAAAGADAGGGGGGGGGTGEGRPVAVIEVTGGAVRIRPVVDWTKVGAAVVAALVTMWIASRRGRK